MNITEISIPVAIIRNSSLSATDKIVYGYIHTQMIKSEHGYTNVEGTIIMRQLKIPERTVYRSLRRLRRVGLVDKVNGVFECCGICKSAKLVVHQKNLAKVESVSIKVMERLRKCCDEIKQLGL